MPKKEPAHGIKGQNEARFVANVPKAVAWQNDVERTRKPHFRQVTPEKETTGRDGADRKKRLEREEQEVEPYDRKRAENDDDENEQKAKGVRRPDEGEDAQSDRERDANEL